MSKLTDPARLQKEIDAQKKRAEALALLSSQGGERHYKPGEVRKAREGKDGDNTLEVVTLRRAQQTYKELSAKDRLLRQQNSVRESVQNKQAGGGKPAAGGTGGGSLAEGWKEVKDATTGATYYWNKSLNTTSWERPVAPPGEQLEKAGSEGEGKTQHADKDKAADARAGNADGEKPGPLPAGWTEVKDPTSGGVYFWNQTKGDTTWLRPTGPASEEEDSTDKSTKPGLPEGWKAVTHAATGQTHYVHEASGKRSFTLPGSQMEPASEQGIAGAGASGSGRNPPQQGRAASHARGSEGRDRGDTGRPKKKGRGGRQEIDPLDPTGKTGGKWSDGLVQVGERMADSTASGPLWQQRPYPAPGRILRGRAPTDAETAGPRQRG